MADTVNAETATVGAKIGAASAAGALWAMFLLPIALIGAVSSMIGIPLFNKGKKAIEEKVQATKTQPEPTSSVRNKSTAAQKRRQAFEEAEMELQLIEQLTELQKKKNRRKASAARASV